MKSSAYRIADEPVIPERFAFLEALLNLLNNAYRNPKKNKLTEEVLLAARHRAVRHTFSGSSLLKTETFEKIKESVIELCNWDNLEEDLKELTKRYHEASTGRSADKSSYDKNLMSGKIQQRINQSTSLLEIMNTENLSKFDLKSKESITYLIDKFVKSKRTSGNCEISTAQAISIADSLRKKLSEIGCSEEYVSWAIASALDSGSYSAFHALNYAEMDFIRGIYEKLDLKNPIFLLSRENHSHRLASCFERNRIGWDCEHDVYQSGASHAANAFEISKEYATNDYVTRSFMETDAHKMNAALEHAFRGVDLDFVPDSFRNESLLDAMLSTMHGDEQRKSWESAARTASCLGREYLRRGYLEEARDLADTAHSYLLNLLSDEDRRLMQGTYVLPVAQNHSPTAWAGWMALRARTDFEMLRRWGQEPKMNVWNLAADAAKLYAGSGAMSWSMSARKTANRVAEHYGSTTRI